MFGLISTRADLANPILNIPLEFSRENRCNLFCFDTSISASMWLGLGNSCLFSADAGKAVFHALIFPEVFKPVRCHFSVPDSVLYVFMTKKVLNAPCVLALVSELKACGVPEHVWVYRQRKLCLSSSPCEDFAEGGGSHWCFALRDKDIGGFRVVTLNLP